MNEVNRWRNLSRSLSEAKNVGSVFASGTYPCAGRDSFLYETETEL